MNEESRPARRLPENNNSSPISLPPTAERVIQDTLSRVVTLREAIADGDLGYAAAVAANLEHDLAGDLHRLQEAA